MASGDGGIDGTRRKRVDARVGPRGRNTLTVVRNKKSGAFRQVPKGGSYDSGTEEALVPEAFKYKSLAINYDLSKDGSKAFVKELNRLVSHLGNQGGRIAYEALRPTFQISQLYVPIDTGALKRSGDLSMIERRGITVAEISYAKNGRPFYANYVHEISAYSHVAPTKAKFLEAAVREDMENIKDRVIKGAKDALGVKNAGKARPV